MKKCIVKMLFVCSMFLCMNRVYALSSNFEFVIQTVGIPRYNAYGKEISEQVYEAYNVFSYSEPHLVTSKDQRWKTTKYGYWAKDIGMYTGSGTRGEYYILGYSYSGEEICNYYFPIDSLPEGNPETWVFCEYPNAANSWKDTTKYKYIEQLEHMKYSKLMFNDLTSKDKADNPNYIKEYNITAAKIGLEKVRLDTAATWRTNGILTTKRKRDGRTFTQIYLIKPMAADAKVVCNLQAKDTYTLTKDKDELVINLGYGLDVKNMSGYAKHDHIKELKASIYINGVKQDEISGSKITSVGNEYSLVITRDRFPQGRNHSVKIKVDGYMHTEFAVDGLMQDSISKTIQVYVEKREIIPVKDTNVMLLEKDSLDWVVSPLAQTAITANYNSIGFTEAGKHLAVKLELGSKDVKILSISLNSVVLDYEVLLEKDNKKILRIRVPKNIATTLYGIDSLREQSGSYFKINTNDIATRKRRPYELKISAQYNRRKYTYSVYIDVLDNYLSNINTSVNKTVLNLKEVNTKSKIKEWIDE